MVIFRILFWIFRVISYTITTIILFCISVLSILLMIMFSQTIELPNGMVVKLEFDSSDLLNGRHDLYAPDRKTLLARGITHICFDDQQVEVIPHGLFNIDSTSPVPGTEFPDEEPFSMPQCGGYFLSSLRPQWLYSYSPGMNKDGWDVCADRNFDNPDLKNEEWLVGPCLTKEDHGKQYGCTNGYSRMGYKSRVGAPKSPCG